MATFWKRRQAILDEYLTETGCNMFVPGEFVDWLQERPDHEAYDWVFGQGDTEAARQHRIALVRRMASGLRIVAKVETTKAQVVHITERQYPAYVSPIAGRKDGGGYVRTDPGEPEMMEELRRQGATALASWLNRYGGAFRDAGHDLKALEKIAAGDAPKVQLRVAQSA